MTLKEKIIGNERIANILENNYKSGKLSHAYLFEGGGHIGKRTFALSFCNLLLSGGVDSNIEQNTDLMILKPNEDKNQILIEQIRDLEKKLSLYPHSSKYKIALIQQADKMSKAASNAILKILEEPNKTAILILLTSNSSDLIDTIKSRCQIFKFLPVKKKILEDFLKSKISDQAKIEKIIELSGYKPGKIIEFINNESQMKEALNILDKISNIFSKSNFEKLNEAEIISKKETTEIIGILDLWIIYFRKILINKYKQGEYNKKENLITIKKRINLINQTKENILTKNINTKLALENLILEFNVF